MFMNTVKNHKDFILHNKKIFSKNIKKNRSIFLIEFNNWQGVQIANSYLINSIPYIKNCKIIAYEVFRDLSNKKFFIFDNIKWSLATLLGIKNFGVYLSFGINKFLYKKNSRKQLLEAKKIANNFFSNLKNKKDVENFSINGVWIGDLIYDSYLKKFFKPTINLNCLGFQKFFEKCVANFLFWEEYFDNNRVKGLATSHTVYLNGIPLRIAVKRGIQTFHCVDSLLYKIDKKICSFRNKTNGFDYHFKLYKKIFSKFKKNDKKIALHRGRIFLKNIISGKQKYFYFPDKKLTNFKKKYFLDNKKKKIVIFAHSFFDSPHVYGNFLFPDFYEWLQFLSQIALKTNYDWYIKPHPNYDDMSIKILDDFIKKNPIIKKIDKNAPNNELVKQGMKIVLTVYGSCAAELPYMGVKVINADRNNPHSIYNFCFHPKNLTEYKDMILNIDKKKLKFDNNDLYEFHYMNQYYFHNNYLFENISEKFLKKNKRQIMYTDHIFSDWMKNFSKIKHHKIINSIKKFYKSNEHYLSLKHTK